MDITQVIKSFSCLFVRDVIEDNFFDVKHIEKKFDVKRIEKKTEDICLLCLEDINEELIAYQCIKCSCKLHHSCLNRYTKSYKYTKCMQCQHMHSSVFNSLDF
jgi:hypothetical protein